MGYYKCQHTIEDAVNIALIAAKRMRMEARHNRPTVWFYPRDDFNIKKLRIGMVTNLAGGFTQEEVCDRGSGYYDWDLHYWLQDYESNGCKVLLTAKYIGSREFMGFVCGQWLANNEMYLVKISVRNKRWGIGSVLMREFEKYCSELGCKRISFRCNPAEYPYKPDEFFHYYRYQQIPGTYNWFKDLGR